TCNGELSVDLCESNFDTKVAVYNGCVCPVTSPPLACNDDAFCGLRSLVTLPVQQGSCYTIRVGGYSGAQGSGVMKLRCGAVIPTGACCGAATGVCMGTVTQTECQALNGVWHVETECGTFVCPTPTPANDACDECIRLLTDIPFDGKSDGATGTDISSCTPGDTKDVWHCWTADCTGSARFDTCGSGFDTSLAIYDACGGNQLACNDDGCSAVPFLRSQIDLDVVEGTTYYIRVSGREEAAGDYRLSVDPCRNACCINDGTCRLVIPALCSAGGGRPAGPGTLCLGDRNGNGVDDACEACPGIVSSIPDNCAIDARQPHQPGDPLALQGWNSVDFTFDANCDVSGATVGDFTVSVTPAGTAPTVSGVDVAGQTVTVTLSGVIPAQKWTCISHTASGDRVCLGSLPADANGDRTAAPVDILDIIDNLNGVLVPPLADHQCDIDRSNLCAPADILSEIDLLNGASGFLVWNGKTLPVCPSAP
ncbi:MAG: hypothetical protein Q7R41_10875, partial [Phycisphaerales bacterium]|nr:hypothetical protein [Phycisphaerales bacterium]